MVYMFLADGFEELEAIAPLDVLRRAGVEVLTVAAQDSLTVSSSHNIPITADMGHKEAFADANADAKNEGLEMVILPGGLGGVKNMAKCPTVERITRHCAEKGIPIAAICAAPSLLGHYGLTRGVRATCYPGFEVKLTGYIPTEEYVVTDGIYTTARGAGVALEFGLELVRVLRGAEEAEKAGRRHTASEQIGGVCVPLHLLFTIF
ncbi:MAG: DJ-1 family glyoxalase III [Eubacteriales bacterium]